MLKLIVFLGEIGHDDGCYSRIKIRSKGPKRTHDDRERNLGNAGNVNKHPLNGSFSSLGHHIELKIWHVRNTLLK